MASQNKVVDLNDWRSKARGQLLTELFKEHESALLTFLRVRLGSTEDSRDIVQEAFYRLARSEDLVETMSNCHSPRAYLFSIVNNLVVDRVRKKVVRQPYEKESGEQIPEAPVNITPETILAANQELEQVRNIIMKLSPRCRRAFILNRFNHMSYRQVAEVMEVPVKRVEKYMTKALAALRKGIEHNDRQGQGGKS